MLLCKIFHKHNPQSQSHPPPQESAQPASRGFDPAYPSYSMSRTAQWVAQQAQQEYQLVQRRPPQPYQTYQTSTVQEARAAYRRAHQAQASPQSRRRPKAPLMDLSSLEGPPIEDSRLVSTPRSLIPRIREEPATSNSRPPGLLWKPLPPRPASAEPQSSRQRRGPTIPPINTHIDPLHPDANLRRVPAQRTGRYGPDDFEDLTGQHASHNFRPRSRTPEITPNYENARPRLRSHSSGPLIWLEDEQQWVVSHGSSSRAHPPVTRLPSRLRNATTRPIRRCADLSDLDVSDVSDVSDDDLERLEYPPDYESHQFSPTYVERYTYGPASRPRASARWAV